MHARPELVLLVNMAVVLGAAAGSAWPHQCPEWLSVIPEHQMQACRARCGTLTTAACAECPAPLQLNRFKMCVRCADDQPSCISDGYAYACCAARQIVPRSEVLPTRSQPDTAVSRWSDEKPPPQSSRPRYWAQRPQAVDVPVPCSNPFGGCSTYKERRESLRTLFSPASEDPRNPTFVECGFVYESTYDAVLERTAADASCETVVYSVNFGAYDHVRPINAGPIPPSTCFFLFVDDLTMHALAAELKELESAEPFWTVVVVPPFPISGQKTARTVKVLAHRFFPQARRSLYFDGKVQFREPVFKFMKAALRASPFVGEGHEMRTNQTTEEEATRTHKRLLFHMEVHHGTIRPADLDELNLQVQQYRAEGYSDSGDQMNTMYLVREHTPEVKLLECAWFNEVDMFSHREQVSLPHAANVVGLSHVVHKQFTLSKCGERGTTVFAHTRIGEQTSNRIPGC